MRKKKIPGKSLIAQKAHFLKGGPMEPGKSAKNRKKRRTAHNQERRAERGDFEE